MVACRMMIVDDDAAVREVLREFVETCLDSIDVVAEASNGEEAVRKARQLEPDVIVMDVRMPVMDGIEATRWIKQDMGLPAVVITSTSFPWHEIREAAHHAGASFHVQKPFDLEQFGRVMKEAAEIADKMTVRAVSV